MSDQQQRNLSEQTSFKPSFRVSDQRFNIVNIVGSTSSPPKQGIRFWGRFDTEKEACEVAKQVASCIEPGETVIVSSPSNQQVILPSKPLESCNEMQ